MCSQPMSKSIEGLEQSECWGEWCTVEEQTPKKQGCSQGTGMEKLLIKSCYKAAKEKNTQLFGILQAICHGHYTATT